MEVVRLSNLSGYSIRNHYQKAVNISSQLYEKAESGDQILLDLSRMDWTTPAFVTPVTVAYNQIVDQGAEINVRLPSEYGRQCYLDQIGFPEGYQEPPNQYENHLPLCLIDNDGGVEIIETVVNGLTRLVKEWFASRSGGNPQTVHYPISEVVKNIGHHSNCDYGAVLIQHYRARDYLDICIVDDGISIPGNFEAHNIEFHSDSNAIKRAMRGEESTKIDRGSRDPGCGLKTTSKLVCEGLDGQVLMASRNGVCHQQNGSIDGWSVSQHSWNGTVFIARLNPPDDGFQILEYIAS